MPCFLVCAMLWTVLVLMLFWVHCVRRSFITESVWVAASGREAPGTGHAEELHCIVWLCQQGHHRPPTGSAHHQPEGQRCRVAWRQAQWGMLPGQNSLHQLHAGHTHDLIHTCATPVTYSTFCDLQPTPWHMIHMGHTAHPCDTNNPDYNMQPRPMTCNTDLWHTTQSCDTQEICGLQQS